MSTKSIIAGTIDHQELLDFWNAHLLPKGLPLLLGLGLGLLLAALIVNESLLFALSVVLLVPSAALIIRDPFMAIVVWMVVLPWFSFKGIYKYVYFTVHRLLIPLALGVLLLSYMLRLRKRKPVQLGPAELAMAAFGAMGVASIFVTGNHWKLTFTFWDRFLVPFMAYCLMRLKNSQERDLRRLLPLMLLLSLAECVIGLVSWFAPQVLPSIWRFPVVGDRVSGTFRQPGAYACVLIFFVVFLYHEAMNREKGPVRTFLILTFSLGMVCVFFTFTRSAWLVGILVLLALLFLYPKPTASLMSVVVPIMVILSWGVLARESAHALEQLNSAEERVEDRMVLANAGKNMFYARPVFGWGYDNYDRYDWRFIERVGDTNPTKWQIRRGTSHNTYLTILAEMGGVGFFLYFFPVIWWLGFTIKTLPRLPKEGFWNRRLLIAMWVPIGAHLGVAQSVDMRFFYYCLGLFWINLGFVASLVQACPQSSDFGTSKWVVQSAN
jgi:O-antigen ligase